MLLILLLGMGSWNLAAKGQERIRAMEVRQLDEGILLTWTIEAGYTCNGISIQRSTDSIRFEEIGSIAGVCGSVDRAEHYRFIDQSPLKNQVNFYRLELGTAGLSPTLSTTFIDTKGEGIRLFPNPTMDRTSLYISKSAHLEATVQLFSVKGEELMYMDTRANELVLDLQEIAPGTYLVLVRLENGAIFTQSAIKR